jgi:hypothetical protein
MTGSAAFRRLSVSVMPRLGVRRGMVRIVEQTDEADADQRAFSIGAERFEEPSAAMRPASHLDDPGLAPVQLVIDARSVRDHVARETREQVRRHAAVVLLGVAEEHVIALRDNDPEVSAPALLGRLDEHTCRIDGEPRRMLARGARRSML